MSRFVIKQSLSLLAVCLLLTAVAPHTRGQQPALTAEQYVEQGRGFAQEKQYDRAVESYRQAIRLKPDLAAAYHGLGSAYISMGRSADALEPLRTAVRLDPNNAVAHINLGITLANLRRFDEALVEMNEAKRLAPNDPRIHNEIGNLLTNGFGRLDDALAAYLEARRLSPGVPAVHHNIGLIYFRQEKYTEAAAPFEEALRLSPQYRNARYFLSTTYSKLGRYSDAVDSWTKFLQIVPTGSEALVNRSWNYLYLGGHGREAATDAHRWLDLYGWRDKVAPYVAVMAHLGYREAGMEQEAQAILAEAVKKSSPNAWPSGVVRYLSGEIGLDELMRLAQDNDQRTEAHTYAGMDLLLKGKADAARTHFEWVKEYGNKRFFEYPLAAEELKRLGK